MLFLSGEEIRSLAAMTLLVPALEQAFRNGGIDAERKIIKMPGGADDRLLLFMRAFDVTGSAVVKLVTIFPDNALKGLQTVQAVVTVFSASGTPEALLDGTTVTHLRTGAASALASKYLSREDSSHLVVIGAGALAPTMAVAHCAVRPIERVSVWGRRPERGAATAATIRSRVSPGVEVHVVDSLATAVAEADIVCCATSARGPLLHGKWLRPGTFVDLVGAFLPSMRETDDEVLLRSRIFVDTFDGAMAEAGDILDPLSRGVIDRTRIEGQLADLASERMRGRIERDEIITFKSVGTAIEDFAAARMIVTIARAQRRQALSVS
jgi:ornithine cyclodeaminase/alanine dehydrogenase-like protein (mu-crystallin family)